MHKECGALIGYYPKEIQTGTFYDWHGDSETWYFIICPNCGEKVEVNKR